MTRDRRGRPGIFASVPVIVFAALLAGSASLLPVCGPFTDVADAAFCPYVLEIFTLGITTGTTPTTYDPSGAVTRLQMAAFLSRAADTTARRLGRRAALGRFWTSGGVRWAAMGLTTLGMSPALPACDGRDVWVPSWNNSAEGAVSRVRAADGRLLDTWTGMTYPNAALAAMEYVFVAGMTSPGSLYRVFPWLPGSVTTVASNLGNEPQSLALDGSRFWTANGAGSVSIITPGPFAPWTVTTVSVGFTSPTGALYDGGNVWITEFTTPGYLRKLSTSGAILQSVAVGAGARFPFFDGTNIWVPSWDNSVTVVRASTGAVLKTLTGNGLNQPQTAAFDGERVLVTNSLGDSVSLWKAADLTPLGSVPAGSGSHPFGACSDGVSFWIGLGGAKGIARF